VLLRKENSPLFGTPGAKLAVLLRMDNSLLLNSPPFDFVEPKKLVALLWLEGNGNPPSVLLFFGFILLNDSSNKFNSIDPSARGSNDFFIG